MENEQNFPKIIHQIFGFWDNKIPKKIQKRIDNWKSHHPEYQHILWNKKSCRQLIKNKFNWFLPIYDNYKYVIQKADAVRYFILYEFGGIYSDIDLEPIKNIDFLLNKYKKMDCILYKSPNSNSITNDFMISKKNASFWKAVWYEMIKTYTINNISKHITVMYTTGPMMLDTVYELKKHKKKSVYAIPTKYINSCDISSKKPCVNKEGCLRRYDGNSWHSIDSTIFNIIYKNTTYILIFIFIIFVFLLLKKSHSKTSSSTSTSSYSSSS